MNLRTIPRAAISGSITLTRLPLDLALTVLPADTRAAKLALDRAEATARVLAGTVLADPALREDGRRRLAAAQERLRAAGLRAQADETAQAANEQFEERDREAERKRRQADARAQARRQQAARRREERGRQAAEQERRRKQASRRAKAHVEQRIDEQAPAARLDALEDKALADHQFEEALAEAGEADRLQAAAERVKEERKEG